MAPFQADCFSCPGDVAVILGQHLLASDVLGGKSPSPIMFVLAAMAALATAILLVRLTTSLLQREKIVFGR